MANVDGDGNGNGNGNILNGTELDDTILGYSGER